MPSLRKILNTTYARFHLKVQPTPVEYYADLIRRGTPFSFSRFGDGEWAAVLSKEGKNCDGHVYFPELGERLRDSLVKAGSYMFGMQNYALRRDGIAICRFLKKHGVSLSWHNSDVFHYANWEGRFNSFITALRTRRVVVVGPAHLRVLNEKVFDYVHFIEIPLENCFLSVDRIRQEMLDAAGRFPGAVFSLSASMAANVLIHDLHPALGKDHTLIDLGSVWDVYAGVLSRGHYRSGDWGEIIVRNLKAEITPEPR